MSLFMYLSNFQRIEENFYVLCYYQEKNNKCQKSVLIDELDRLGLS